jgi:hypothetical protein
MHSSSVSVGDSFAVLLLFIMMRMIPRRVTGIAQILQAQNELDGKGRRLESCWIPRDRGSV